MGNDSLKAVVLIVCAGLVYPSVSRAQSLSYITPAISIGGVYDDNVFFTSGQKEGDFLGRLSPELAAGIESEKLDFYALYTFDAEYYADNSQLNDAMIRQHALANLQYELSRLVRLSLDSRYDVTEIPGELDLHTALNGGRNNARRFSAGPSLEYDINPLTRLALGYVYTYEKENSGIEGETHSARTAIDRQINRNNSLSLAYTFYHYIFEDRAGKDSHVPMLGWLHRFSPASSISLSAGPRITDGDVSPEIAVNLQRSVERGEFSFNYVKTESTVIGQIGTVDNDSIGLGIYYELSRDLELDIQPLFSRLEQSGNSADVYQLGLQLAYRMNEYMSIVGAYDFSLQDGSLDDRIVGNIERNVFMLSVKFSTPDRGNRPRRGQTR